MDLLVLVDSFSRMSSLLVSIEISIVWISRLSVSNSVGGCMVHVSSLISLDAFHDS